MDKDITSKKLVRGVFESAELPRLPFFPWIFSHAARLEQIPLRRMFNDPTQYVKCLQNTRKLYGYDAIISGFDPSLETEICGCLVSWGGDYETPMVKAVPDFDFDRLPGIDVESAGKTGRFGTVIESIRRINMVSGQGVALAAVVTGPLTVTQGLSGRDIIKDFLERPEEARQIVESTSSFLLKVVQTYCQLQLDMIVIADRLMSRFPAAHLAWLESVLSPIINNIRFYNAYSVLLRGDSSPEDLAGINDLGFDGIVASNIDNNTWNQIKKGKSCILGKAIPSSLFTSSKEELGEYIESYCKDGFEPGVFLTTDWEVPPETPPENIRLVIDIIAQD
jgi:uroporphyrinogen-III decarboxylase